MSGQRARTNFPYNPNTPQSSASKLLSATLTAKLHRCYMTSLQMNKPQNYSISCANTSNEIIEKNPGMGLKLPEKRTVTEEEEEEEAEPNWVVKKVKVENTHQFESLEDDHIEQMIQELIHYGSFELCSSSL